MKYGLDVSKHQGAINYDALVKAEFNIVRTGYGINKATQTDEYFHRNMQESIKKGYAVGAYHASYAKDVADAVTEANFACDLCEEYKADMSEPIFFDFEYFSSDYIKSTYGIETTPQLVQELTTAFCERVLKRGFETGVYYNKDYHDRFYGESYFLNHPQYKTWYARPGYSQPDKPCDYWQYASNAGPEYGYAGAIDKNVAYIALHEFDAAPEIEPMKPLATYPVVMVIGFASGGDVANIQAKLTSLSIPSTESNGYIVTSIAVSTGDQCEIMMLCDRLGVPYGIGSEEPTPAPEPEPSDWQARAEKAEALAEEYLAKYVEEQTLRKAAQEALQEIVNGLKQITQLYDDMEETL